MQVWNVLHAARWKYRTQKFAICAPSHIFVGLYLCNWGVYQQLEKKLVKQQYLLHMSSQRPSNCWDRLASWGHPSKFQHVSCLGFVTAPTSLSGSTTFNRGRHLYIFCRAAITLGISPHSSSNWFLRNTSLDLLTNYTSIMPTLRTCRWHIALTSATGNCWDIGMTSFRFKYHLL